MRKFIKSLALVAVAAMTLSACQKEVELQKKNADGLYEYSFAILEDGTKAVIGDSNIEWVTGDQVGMFVGSYKGYAKVDVNKTPRMVVLYSNQVIPAGTMAYAYSPFDGSNTDATNAKITLSEIQSGAAISAMPLAGIPFEVKEEVEAGNQEGNGAIKFLNLGSLINFKIYSSNVALQSETITSVKFEATKRLAGTGTLDLTAVNMNDEGTLELDFEGDDEIHFVKVDGQSVAVAASKDDATPIKMVVLPGSFEGTLTITTDAATYTKVMPEREYVRSGLRTWGLDLTKAERVEGVEEVVKTLPYDEPFSTNKGDFSIENIVMPEGLTAVWTHGSHNTDSYMQATAYVGGTRYATESMLVSPWINLAGVTAAEVSFDNAYKYVSAPADYFTCWVKTDETGAEWVKKTIDNYGAGNFAWGSATIDLSSYVGKKVKVAFKYISGGETSNTGTWEIMNFSAYVPKVDPEISYERETWDINLGATDYEGQELTNPHELTVTYSSSDESIVVVDENTGDVVIGDKVGSAVITATFAGNDEYKAGTAIYTISVVNPNVEYKWVKTAITDLVAGDMIVIVDETSSFALPNNGGTSSAPSAVAVTIVNDKLAEEPESTLQWVLVIPETGKYQFKKSGSDYLYTTNNNNGVRVGTNSNNVFTLSGNHLYNVATSRYVGVYDNQDWRCYTSSGGNIATTKTVFFKNTEYTPVTPSTYNISFSEGIVNGSVSASKVTGIEEGESITLTISPSEGYVLESLVVNNQNVTTSVYNNRYTFNMPGSNVVVSASFKVKPASADFTPSDFDGQGTSGSGSAISATKSGITFACNKGYGSGTSHIRCYSGGTITITAESGKTITGISFSFSGSYNGGLETTYTGLSTSSWEQTLSAQARFTAITVTYE